MVEKCRILIGGLIYLTLTRPDISFIVGVLSRYMNKPTKIQSGVAKRVLRYLTRTMGFGSIIHLQMSTGLWISLTAIGGA